MLTTERARELLSYNPENGELTWNRRVRSDIPSGSRAGWVCTKPCGYSKRGIRIDGVNYTESHVIWIIMTGEMPSCEIDHINRDATDNRWVNLRVVSHHDNNKNKTRQRRNKTGVTGVYWRERKQIFVASIRVDGKGIYLGSFKTIEGAAAARRLAENFYGIHTNNEPHGSLVDA